MSASSNARAGRILEDLTSAVASLDLVVEDVTVMPAGKRRLVRVLVDRDLRGLDDTDTTSQVAPLDLDQVADATRLISDRLDSSDAMGEQAYVLEVSSPGTDRPLTEPRHFRRNVGRLVDVTTDSGEQLAGRIVEADAHGIRLEVTGDKGRTSRRELTYAECARTQVQVEFNRPDQAVDHADEDGEDD
ncbi:ribosome maturation factor RimP [Leekyejoonella antrihumi]|uniref:Ribosome maturation factor RimP n=1 Tax=Leekyejoonella antrihumi TaxID=1660198 RepID=A0A563DW10_9MICO|nr:ribosome maturation factor RimP [Leekyejoonella antrihumi]TWP34385.1 ribosome maturation factor RimP [Leekyejoonella antrihumi]